MEIWDYREIGIFANGKWGFSFFCLGIGIVWAGIGDTKGGTYYVVQDGPLFKKHKKKGYSRDFWRSFPFLLLELDGVSR